MIISTENFTKQYPKTNFKALDNLNLEVAEGEIFGFIGPNGAGKSTTIRLLLDLIRPTNGSAKIFGYDISRNSLLIRKEVGYLPGEIFLPENMTGEACIKYYSGFKRKIDKSYLKNLYSKLDFNPEKKIRDYSKGNKQKLAIILAVMHKPKLLIMDEPTSGLDPLNQQTFYNLITEAKKWGTTTFFSTHLLEEAEKICDRVGILKDGKLLAIEDIDEFKQKNIREINLVTTDSIPLSHFKIPGIDKVERTTTGYRLVSVGPNAKIIKELLHNNITDIKISEPSLEEIFMHFYKK